MPSPAAEVETMKFSQAIELIATGQKVRRQSWPEGSCIFLQANILHLRKEDGSMHTLIVSSGDLEGTDWVVVREH